MAKIAVVHVPYFSHINALTRLTAVLVRQGHEVIAWAPEPCRRRIEAAGATLEVLNPEMPRVDGFMGWVAALTETTEQCSRELIEQLFDYDVDLVLHDSQAPWARVAGDHLGVPRIVSHPMFPIVSPEHVRSDEEWDLPAPHPAEAQERFEASWRAIAQRWGVELGDTVGIIHSAWTSETVVAFTTEEMVGDWGLPDGWHCIGPLLEPPPPRVPAGERPLVYVCFGTSFNGRPELFRAVVEGVRDEPYDVLVSMGDGRLSADDLGPLPANVVVRDFVPGRDMLARAAVHVTHGGNNSVHESLLAGVPMLFIPQAYDQFPLAWRVDQLGAGAVAAEDPANIRAGIRWLIEDESPTKRANELAQHLVDFDGEARVAALIEGVLAGDEALSA